MPCATRILITDHGRLVASGTAAQLKNHVSGDAITLEIGARDAVGTAVAVVRDLAGATSITVHGRQIGLRVPSSGRALPVLLRELGDRGIELQSVEVSRPTLDDVFLGLTGRTLRDQAA